MKAKRILGCITFLSIAILIYYLFVPLTYKETERNLGRHDLSNWLATRETLYEKARVEQAHQIENLKHRNYRQMIQYNKIFSEDNAKVCEKAKYHLDLPFPYFIFKPIWNCPFEERIGEIFDGGKWLCNVDRLERDKSCIIYSFGSNGLVEFETDIRRKTNCVIHIFDPTVSLKNLPDGIFFHPWCLSGEDGECVIGGNTFKSRSLATIIQELGHKRINLLKIDIDGYEWEVIDKLDEDHLNLVDEMSIEFHWHGLDAFVRVMTKLQNIGFRAFHNEPNLFYYVMPSAGIEYSFVRPEYTL